MVAQGSEEEGYEVFVKYSKMWTRATLLIFKHCGELKEEVNLLRDQATGIAKELGF